MDHTIHAAYVLLGFNHGSGTLLPMDSLEEIRSVLLLASKAGVDEIELVHAGMRFAASFDPCADPVAVSDDTDESEGEPPHLSIVSTAVGYFENRSPALSVGDSIKQGETVGRIAALGLVNDVEADVSGSVVAVLIQQGDAVEYGQPLFQVRTEH